MGGKKSYIILVISLVLLSNISVNVNAQLKEPIPLKTIEPILLDSDKDGVGDTVDNCPATSNADQADKDGDGVGDVCDNCPANSNSDQADTDGDGVGDVCERIIITRPPVTLIPVPDADGDRVYDTADNCPNTYNPDQDDRDGDGVGDACEIILLNKSDLEETSGVMVAGVGGEISRTTKLDAILFSAFNDSIYEQNDDKKYWIYKLRQYNEIAEGLGDYLKELNDHLQTIEGRDSDEDGLNDYEEEVIIGTDPLIPDTDGDGIFDSSDNCPLIPNPDQADKDGYGVGDACPKSDVGQTAQIQADEWENLVRSEKTKILNSEGIRNFSTATEASIESVRNPRQATEGGAETEEDEKTKLGMEEGEVTSPEATEQKVEPEINPLLGLGEKTAKSKKSRRAQLEIFASESGRQIIVARQLKKSTKSSQKSPESGELIFPTLIDKDVESFEDLVNYTEAVMAADENIEKIAIKETNIEMDYRMPAKLFGLINVDYTLSTNVDSLSGKVEVKKSWWTIFTRGDVDASEVEKDLEEDIAAQGDLTDLDRGGLQQKGQEEIQVLTTQLSKVNDEKKNLSEDLTECQQILSEPNTQYPLIITLGNLTQFINPQGIVDFEIREQTITLNSKEQLEVICQNIELDIQTLTDMSQQLQLQLQDAMNKQQQTMQILSNIMKNQHDTLKAIIQNMRA